MIKPGSYMRKKVPALYFMLVTVINSVRRLFRPYSIYITDNLGGSFKDYFREQDMGVRLEELKRGLDNESVETIDVILKRLMKYPDERNKKRISRSAEIFGGLLPVERMDSIRTIRRELKQWRKAIKFPGKHIGESVFYFHHGLRFLPPEVVNFIRGKDFIDAGAFIGDSAIALREYGYRKIFSIEISEKSIGRYRFNMLRNNITPDRFEIINAGIASNDDEAPVKINDTGSAGFSLIRRTGKYDEITVVKKSIDRIVEEHNISPAFIKVDIEGYGIDFVTGARQTLTRFRPVLSIAIYHNPYEFFEIKPMLEEMLPGYNFMVRKLATGTENNLCHSEVILLGYPSEFTGKEIEDF